MIEMMKPRQHQGAATGCDCCPFECRADRIARFGVCKAPAEFKIARIMAHFWEEPCISGTRGSGTVFFSHCNASCLFCQNYRISQLHQGSIYQDADFITACRQFIETTRVHNLNLVSPTHYSGRLLKILPRLKQEIGSIGLLPVNLSVSSPDAAPNGVLPIVWNSNGYEKASVIERLSGLVDVFLPDLKYFDNDLAVKFSRLPDYFQHAARAIAAMQKIVGDVPVFDREGIMHKGMIIRHLILPGQVENSKKILTWIARNLGTQTYVSLMSQYYPVYRACQTPDLDRRLNPDEYQEVEEHFLGLGFENGFLQDLDSNSADYTPEF
ncbi:MAG: radical SAM protein [bacterium]